MNIYLEKIAGVLSKIPGLEKDLIRNKPLVPPTPKGTLLPNKLPRLTGPKLGKI